MPPTLLRQLSSRPKSGMEHKEGGHQWINTCRTDPFPAFIEDADEEDETEPTPDQPPNPEADFPDEPLEEGDQIWATGLFPQAEPHLHDRYGFPAARGGFLTELSTCGS